MPLRSRLWVKPFGKAAAFAFLIGKILLKLWTVSRFTWHNQPLFLWRMREVFGQNSHNRRGIFP